MVNAELRCGPLDGPAAGLARIFATMTTLTASLHERQKGQEVVLVQPIHELLRHWDGVPCAVRQDRYPGFGCGRLRRRQQTGLRAYWPGTFDVESDVYLCLC